MRRFVLLATQRTGSSWVQEMLNSHPEAKVYNELFLPEGRGAPLWEPNDLEFANTYVEARAGRPKTLTKRYWTVRYLEELFADAAANAVGVKLMYNQLQHRPEIIPYLIGRRVAVVHLVRRNLLDVFVSAALAQATGVYHAATDGRPSLAHETPNSNTPRLHVPPHDLLAALTQLDRHVRIARRCIRVARQPALEVAYEDLVAAPAVFDELLRFLDLRPLAARDLSSALVKRNVRSRAQVIANFDEVAAALVGTRFASFLADQ